MGQLKIELAGSFAELDVMTTPVAFSAEEGGHADAIARAITFLSGTALPSAIRLDHRLAAMGQAPRKPFGHGNKP